MRIALYQARTGVDPARNIPSLEQACRTAAAGSATMLFTPEMSGLLDRKADRADPHVTDEDGDPAAAQCGRHEDGRETYGHSLVVDPWGRVLLDMGEAQDVVGFAEIDPAAVNDARAAVPALRHRRSLGTPELAR